LSAFYDAPVKLIGLKMVYVVPLTCLHCQTTGITVVPRAISKVCRTVHPRGSGYGVVKGSGRCTWQEQHR